MMRKSVDSDTGQAMIEDVTELTALSCPLSPSCDEVPSISLELPDRPQLQMEPEIPAEAKQRLQLIEAWRRKNEQPYRMCARKRRKNYAHDGIGVTPPVSPSSLGPPAVANVPPVEVLPDQTQTAEMNFIFSHFSESACSEFQPMKHYNEHDPQVCKICGLTAEFHEPEDALDGFRAASVPDLDRAFKRWNTLAASDSDLIEPTTHNGLLSFAPRRTPLPTITITSGSRHTLTDRLPASTFGSVFIPQRFTGRVAGPNSNRQPCRKYIRFDPEATTMASVWTLLTSVWKLKTPSLVLSITGGIVVPMDSCIMKRLSAAINKLVNDTDAWILSDGRNHGASKFLGRLLTEENDDSGSKDEVGHSSPDSRNSPVLIGVSHWGSLKRKKLLYGISLPSVERASRYFYSLEYQLARSDHPAVLNPYQSAYLLLDNGKPTDSQRCVTKFRAEFDRFLKKDAADNIDYVGKGVTLPVVTLVIGGDGLNTLAQVREAVNSERPVVIVMGSNRSPTLLAELFYALEDKVPRTWTGNVEWDEREERTFNEYLKQHGGNIRDIFHITANDADPESEAKRKESVYGHITCALRSIMEQRYYITIVDCELESGQDLYSSILRGIYKGYTRRSGLSIALKTCRHEFLEALFHRTEEIRDEQKHFITVESLNELHLDNMCHDRSMTSILKMVCKRESYSQNTVESQSILPVVGRILHLLMGPRYKIIYHEPEFKELKEELTFTNKKTQIWHLMLWSILSNKPAMTHFFVLQSAAPLGASLIAFMLYSRLARWADEGFQEELKRSLDEAAEHFQKLAIHILDRMYDRDVMDAYRVLVCELPFDLGPYITPLVIADDAKAMDFMSQGCCQTFLQKVWKGNMAVDTPSWKSLPIFTLVPFLVLPWIHFYDSSLTPKPKQAPPPLTSQQDQKGSTLSVTSKCDEFGSAFDHFRFYVRAPVTKFYAGMLSYLCFLGLLSYFVLTDLAPFTTWSAITPAEWILIVWIISHLIEELVQVFGQHDTGPLYTLSHKCLPKSVWHRTEILNTRLFPIHIYIHSGCWNAVDITIVALFVTSFALRFALPMDVFQLSRVIFAVTTIFCYFRLLRFWFVLPSIGPRIIAIQMMLTELLKFLLVLAVFVVSFGIAFQAILHPNQPPSGSTIVDILWRPYWQMFGELYLDDGTGGMGRDVSDTSCAALMAAKSAGTQPPETEEYCMWWAAPVLLGVYLLIANVLLLNLLVAIFSQAYEDVKGKSHTVFLFNLFNLIEECYYQTAMPPPLSLVERCCQLIMRIVRHCCKTRRSHSEFVQDAFRLDQSAVKDDVQKIACENVMPYKEPGAPW